jgi:hypothetical protein
MLEIKQKFPEIVLRINLLEEAKELLLALASLPYGEPDMVTLLEAKEQLTTLLKEHVTSSELCEILNPFPEEEDDDEEDLLDGEA